MSKVQHIKYPFLEIGEILYFDTCPLHYSEASHCMMVFGSLQIVPAELCRVHKYKISLTLTTPQHFGFCHSLCVPDTDSDADSQRKPDGSQEEEGGGEDEIEAGEEDEEERAIKCVKPQAQHQEATQERTQEVFSPVSVLINRLRKCPRQHSAQPRSSTLRALPSSTLRALPSASS